MIKCTKCDCEYCYEVNDIYICPECSHEWSKHEKQESEVEDEEEYVITDANGVVLNDGDTVALMKDLKVKGSSSTVKVGTKVKNIRLIAGDHDIDCKVPGIGAILLKSQFVKKV